MVLINGTCPLKSPFKYFEKSLSCKRSKLKKKPLNSVLFYNLTEHKACPRASWSCLHCLHGSGFISRSWKVSWGKENFVVSLLIFLEEDLQSSLGHDGDFPAH